MEKLNIAEILKDCPSGMELDCVVLDNLYFDKVDEDEQSKYPIFCFTIDENGNRNSIVFTENGYFTTRYGSKCAIFPKGKTTWEGFQRPFKDGDIVATSNGNQMFIFKKDAVHVDEGFSGVCYFGYEIQDSHFFKESRWRFSRHAAEEEKQKLFDVIKANGYKWNPETKTLEKLIELKFKVGDKIRHKTHIRQGNTVTEIKDTHYILDDESALPFTSQYEYELVPNKFDITTLKAFNKVLVRDNDTQKWTADLFSFFDKSLVYPYSCVGHYTNQCIPYNDETKHLIGTTNECSEYYKIWE